MSDERKRRRVIAIVALLVAGGALAYLATANIGESLVYYWSPTELLAAGEGAKGASIRLGGLVADDSVIQSDDGLTLKFTVTDGESEIVVHAEAVPPAMFREAIGVVVEGTLSTEGHFESDRLMIKHDNEYQAPEGHDTRSMEQLMKSLQFEGTRDRVGSS